MPKSTIPADSAIRDFLDSTELSGGDLIQVWDRSTGDWKWTTLAQLEAFFTAT
tara:strand:- start:765 stop:923 length:159 start_codon:yes stop_codon:yes gene_type:complete